MRQWVCRNALGYLLLEAGSGGQFRSQGWGRIEKPADPQGPANKVTYTWTPLRTRRALQELSPKVHGCRQALPEGLKKDLSRPHTTARRDNFHRVFASVAPSVSNSSIITSSLVCTQPSPNR